MKVLALSILIFLITDISAQIPDDIPKTIEELKIEIVDIKLKNDDIIRRHKEAGVLFEVAKRYKFVGNVMMLTSLVLSLSIPVEDKNLYTRRDPRLPILACGVSIGLICSISANYKINKMHHLLFYY